MERYDLVVVGAGIVGLAHALAAWRRGMRVCVAERDHRARSASVRNFGFVTLSGQEEGATRRRALRSLQVWNEIAPRAGIDIVQRGALVVAQRAEAMAVLEQFAAGPMGAGCALWDPAEAARRVPALRAPVAGALWSPHELRVEAREALPRLAAWLERACGVAFAWDTDVAAIEGTTVRHAMGTIEGAAIVVAPGTGFARAAPALARRVGSRLCKLQMMRLAAPAWRLPGVLMSDLSLVRYGGFAVQAAAPRLRERLEREAGAALREGVHLIVAQGADGSLVVGDSHAYVDGEDPFASDAIDALILAELARVLDLARVEVIERWIGYYPVGDAGPVVSEALAPGVRLVAITSGAGMSTAFALAEETLAAMA
jgi:FAD dependent oxidoreductase TIGR03364